MVEPSPLDARALFTECFGGAAPTLLVRAPGRVNLIGEHIDYSLLPVLPMAIQRGTSLAVRPRRDGVVRLRSADEAYRDVEITLSGDIPPGKRGDWGNYARGIAQDLVREFDIARGADIAVGSVLPIAAGLSSSTALSAGVALALLAVNDREVDRVALAEQVARSERYTGTQGGGMDQAVILCGREGHAVHLSFEPLSIRPVEVPSDWIFLVAHSGHVAEKSGRAQDTYNTRAQECREALAAVWAVTQQGSPPDKDYRPLVEGTEPDRLLNLASGVLGAPLLARFRHVVGEAKRVADAERALAAGDFEAFGQFMQASHRSLRDDYEVSTPELDRLVDLSGQAGAAGARLTGAGLGGAALVLCCTRTETAVRDTLASEYYGPRGLSPSEDVLFRVVASGGATVTRLDGD